MPLARIFIVYLALALLLMLLVDTFARWRHGVWPSVAVRSHRRYRLTLEAIAGAALTAGDTLQATEAQWLRSLARSALDPHRDESAEAQHALLDRQISIAMAVHNHRQGPAPAPEGDRPPPA